MLGTCGTSRTELPRSPAAPCRAMWQGEGQGRVPSAAGAVPPHDAAAGGCPGRAGRACTHVAVCAQPPVCTPRPQNTPGCILFIFQSRLMIRLSYLGNLITSTVSAGR